MSPKATTSRGCNQCVVCPGSCKRITALACTNSYAAIYF
jgi:hypothetical protein